MVIYTAMNLPWKVLSLYLGVYDDKLRYFTAEGELVPTPQEAALQERQQKEYERQQKELALQQQEYERQQKELAQKRIEELTARLQELGVELD